MSMRFTYFMSKVFYLSMKKEIPANDYWGYGLLNDFIDQKLWDVGLEFDKKEVSKLSKCDSAIIVVPGEYHADKIDEINDELQKIKRVVLFIMADEEAKFPVEKIDHKSIEIWVQYPDPSKHNSYNKFPTGYPPQSQSILPLLNPNKTIDIFFSGQMTHKRRIEVVNKLNEWVAVGNTADVVPTRGFTQGLKPDDYYKRLLAAKIAPCPAGTITPDSFRVFEALESMCVVLADNKNSQGTVSDYWNWLFGSEPQFTTVDDWNSSLIGYSQEALENWPGNAHQQTAWWIKWKRDFSYKVKEQLNG